LGYQNFVYVVKLSVSITKALEPSIVILKLEPIESCIELKNSIQGFFKSINHSSSILNNQTSEVAQNLFFKALKILKLSNLSHSKYNTVSTICSKVFGQAKLQSFVICQIIIILVSNSFENSINFSVIYLT
jgi:hypothetical protein